MISPAARPAVPAQATAMSGWSVGPRLHIVILLFALIAISLHAHAHDLGVLVRSSPRPQNGITVHSTALGASDSQSNPSPDTTPLAVRLSVTRSGFHHFLRMGRSNDLICHSNWKKAGISRAFERLNLKLDFVEALERVMRCNAYLICNVTYLSIILFGRAAGGDETCLSDFHQ